MSVKRGATTELNHVNWDQEEPNEPEDMEGFKTAPEEVLAKRVIRTAKRRSNMSNNDGQKSSVFSGFGGFNKVQKSSFDFLANLTNGNKTNTSATKQEEAKSLFTSKPFTNSPSTGLSAIASTSGPSKTATPQSSLFSKPSQPSSPTGNKMLSTETGKDSHNDNPFKIQTTTTSLSSFNTTTQPNPAPFSTTQSSLTFGSATNSPKALTKSSPFKMTSTPSIFNISPSKAANTLDKNTKNEINEDKDNIDEKKLKYYKNIKGLNVSVSDWIKKHVEDTPLCILTPIFKDYEKHLKEIQDEYFNKETKSNGEQGDFKQNSNEIKSPQTHTGLFSNSANNLQTTKLTSEKAGGFSFGSTSSNNAQKNNTDKAGFTFGNMSLPQNSGNSANSLQTKSTGFVFGTNTTTPSAGLSIATTTNSFSFGVNPSLPSSSFPSASPKIASGNENSSFTFGSGKPFSFNSNIQTKPDVSDQKNNNEDEDEPPKVEFTPLVEDNSVFDKKCKIFFKKDGNFVDKGVGTLYIKKIADSEKHQLLLRANTSLGNILLNLVMSSSIPMQRMGKNNVMLVCIPTPDTKPPPTPVLIRVKTSEEADDLLEILNKYKK